MFSKGYDPKRNTKGRPPVANSVATLARDILESKKKGQKSKGEQIILKFVELALGGSAPHANFLFDRAYGKAAETMNLSGGLSLYEQGASEAARLADEAGRKALLVELRKLTGAKK